MFENGAETILRDGLAYDRCQVGIVTDVKVTSKLAEFDVRELPQVFNVLRTQVDVVLPDGAAVLNADDPQVADMARLCDGEVIFFGADRDTPSSQSISGEADAPYSSRSVKSCSQREASKRR